MNKMTSKLTKKEKGFIVDYVKTGNGTQSVMKNYNVTNENSAGVIAHVKLSKVKIQKVLNPIVDRYKKELDAILKAMELKNKNSEQYRTLVDAADKIQKQIQLLTGGSTDNVGVIPIMNIFKQDVSSRNSNNQDSQTEEET